MHSAFYGKLNPKVGKELDKVDEEKIQETDKEAILASFVFT